MGLFRKKIIIKVPLDIPELIKTTADASDYLLMIDNEGTLYKITKANLLAGLSGNGTGTGTGGTGTGGTGTGGTGTGGTGTGGTTDKTLTYSSNGDANGLFYYLGTNALTTEWSNPATNGSLSISASTTENGTPTSLSDRSTSEWFSNINANNYVQFQLTSGKLKCNKYSIRTRSNDVDYYPRNWQLLGSNNGTSWDVLDEQVNNNTLVSVSQWLTLPVSTTTKYSYFRLLQNGVDSSGAGYLCLGEVEFYGIYTP